MNPFRASHKTQGIKHQNPYLMKQTAGVCLQNTSDYSPFGVSLDGRTIEGDFYRRGFNGMEKDDEVKGKGNSYDFGARMYDSRVGRFLSLDPKAFTYPWQSPYVFAANNPVNSIDENGEGPGDPRELFYKKMGTAAINTVKSIDVKNANDFKALYIISQYRMENSFNLNPPGNNPFNIKGKGDKGQVTLKTTEYIRGKKVVLNQNFANFTTIEKGFEGYIKLLKSNFNDAYRSLTDDTKTVADFANGLQNGRLGQYATNPNYANEFKEMLSGVIKDYDKMLDEQISQVRKELNSINPDPLKREEMITKQLIKGIDMHSKEFQTAIKIMELEGEIKGLKSEKSELKKFKKNEGL